jgi:hypothetical protein
MNNPGESTERRLLEDQKGENIDPDRRSQVARADQRNPLGEGMHSLLALFDRLRVRECEVFPNFQAKISSVFIPGLEQKRE